MIARTFFAVSGLRASRISSACEWGMAERTSAAWPGVMVLMRGTTFAISSDAMMSRWTLGSISSSVSDACSFSSEAKTATRWS